MGMAEQTTTPTPTALYQLIEARLGGSLADFIASRRSTASWRAIAVELTAKTGVEVSGEVVRRWFADRIQVEVTVRP